MKTMSNKFRIQGLVPVFSKILALSLAVWAFVENTLLLSVRHEILGGDLKIAHISDVHKKKFGKKAVNAVRKQNPDIIVISGDLVSRDESDFSTIHSTIQQLCRICPVYMALGNHEQSIPPHCFSRFIRMIQSTDAILLRNQYSFTQINGKKLTVCGLEVPYTTYKKDGKYKNLDSFSLNDMKCLVGEPPHGNVLLIAHNPLFGSVYSQWGADFVLSGHLHGGIVRIFGKPLLSPERKFFPPYSKGIYRINNTLLMVSAGIGKLRLFNPPEIPVYSVSLK